MRRLQSLAVIAVLGIMAICTLAAPALADDDQVAQDVAMARAKACVIATQATGHQTCVTAECHAAEIKAAQLAAAAVKGDKTERPAIVDPATKKRYTWRPDIAGYWLEGQDPQPRASGRVPSQLPAGDACYIDPVTGQRVCPYQRR